MEHHNTLDIALQKSQEVLRIVKGDDPRFFTIDTDTLNKPISCNKVIDENSCSVVYCKQPGRTKGIFHYHKYEYETFVCIKGKGILHYNHLQIELLPGKSINISPTVNHRFAVETEEDCEYVVVTHPRLNI